LTGDQLHTDHIATGQRVSLHSLPTLCFLFFYQRTFLKTIPTSRTVKHIWFFQTHNRTLKNQKSLPLPTHDNIVDFYTIRQCIFTIFNPINLIRLQMNRIKEVLKEKGISQAWLAQKLDKSYNTINEYARNVRQPSIDDLYRIAKILDINAKDLLKEE